MPQFERGVYEPNDDVRVFDGSEGEEDVEGSRLPLLIVLALLVLAMFAGVVWLAYTQGVARGRTETPVIAAAAGPARIAPQNPGGAQQPYQGFKIYEQPAPPDDDTAGNTAQPATATPPAATAAAAPPPAAPVTAPAPTPPPKMAAAEPETAPVTAPAPPPAPVKIQPAAAKPVPVAKAVAPAPKPAPQVPVQAQAQPQPLMIGPATAPPRSLGTAATAPVQHAAAASHADVAGGATVLQIGAYKSQADADAAWKAYKAKHAALLSGYAPNIQQADLGDKGTWYRLRIAGFSSRDVASALCDRLKTDGGICFLGK